MSFCQNCGQQTADGVTVCETCCAAQQPVLVAAETVGDSLPMQPKKSKKLPILLSLCAVVAAAVTVVVIGWLTNWFGTVSPLQGIIDAVSETLSAKNLTLHFEINEGTETHPDRYSGDARIVLNKDERQLSFHAELQDDNYFSIEVLHDSTIYHYTERGEEKYGYYESFDDDAFELVFDALETLESDDMDWDDIFETVGLNDYDDYIHTDRISAFLEAFYKNCLCDGDWLEEFLGFTKTSDTYSFSVDVKKLGKELINIIVDSEVLTDDGKKLVKELKKELNSVDLDVEFSVTLNGDYLSTANVNLEYEGYRFSLFGQVSAVNKTFITDTEMDALAQKIDDLKERCKGCNDLVIPYQDGYCSDCYYRLFDYCDNCAGYKVIHSNGYCEDCYNDLYGYCDYCGDYDRLYENSWGTRLCCWCY